MKQFICFFSGLLLLFVSTTRVVAQEVSDYSQLSEEDYSKIVLPPLSALFENAKNSPAYEVADVKAIIERISGFLQSTGKLSIRNVRQ